MLTREEHHHPLAQRPSRRSWNEDFEADWIERPKSAALAHPADEYFQFYAGQPRVRKAYEEAMGILATPDRRPGTKSEA